MDGNKILWIGTLGSGLTKIDRKTNQCTYYKHEPSINNSLAGDDVYSLYEDSEGYIWLGAGNALQKYNPIQNKFITYMKIILLI